MSFVPHWHLKAFGLTVSSNFQLPGADVVASDRLSPSLRISKATLDELPGPGTEARFLRSLHVFDGLPYVMLQGTDGDVVFQYGREALFYLSSDHRELKCAVRRAHDPVWQRVLLDTVLWTVSILHGFELLHASAVETKSGVLTLVAPTGGGKSSLAAEFLRRGATLFADDVVALDAREGTNVIAHPGPPLMNLPSAIDLLDLEDASPLHEFRDETWVALRGAQPKPQPLGTVVIVDRQPTTNLECTRTEVTSLTFLPYMAFLPQLHHEADLRTVRDRRRFSLISALVEQTPVLRLTADPSVPTAQLADLLESATSRP